MGVNNHQCVDYNLMAPNAHAVLHYLIEMEYLEHFRLYIVNSRVNVNLMSNLNNRSPLSMVLQNSSVTRLVMLELLLNRTDLNVNIDDRDGNFPMKWAIMLKVISNEISPGPTYSSLVLMALLKLFKHFRFPKV